MGSTGCPENTMLEGLVLQTLGEAQAAEVQEHLKACASCRREAAFLAATRLALPAREPVGDCLSDEALCLCRDGLLEGDAGHNARVHLESCPRCMAALVSLDRALEESARAPAEVSRLLMEKAVLVGTPAAPAKESDAPPFLQRLLQGSLGWRLAAAGAVAALVLALFVVGGQSNRQEAPKLERLPRPPEVAQGPVKPAHSPTPPDRGVAPPKHDPQAPSPPVLVGQTGTEQPTTAGPEKSPSTPPADQAGWLAELSANNRQTLAAKLRPGLALSTSRLGQALAADPKLDAYPAGFRLGQAMAFLRSFAPSTGDGPEQRKALSETAQALAPYLRTALGTDPSLERALMFAEGVSRFLDGPEASSEKAARRVAVLAEALSDSLKPDSPAGAGYRLGLVSADAKLLASAAQAGSPPPDPVWAPVRESLDRLQKIQTGSAEGLGKNIPALDGLRKVLDTGPAPDSAKVLSEIQRLDRALGVAR